MKQNMKENNIVVGSVVLSKMGRDKGNYFVVVAVGNSVYICDGDRHRLASPKKKNPKHLSDTGTVLELIANKLANNKKVFDSEINSAIRQFGMLSNS